MNTANAASAEYDVTWMGRDQPWWVKLRRAGVHIREVTGAVEAFQQTRPWRVEAEPGEQPGVVAYRLHIDRQPPADLLAAVGDAVHNLRSALDAMTYDLAVRHLGTLTSEQEQATQLPICKDEEAFQRLLDKKITKGNPQQIRDLYGPNGVAGLRCVQPFALSDEAKAMGVKRARTAEEDLQADALYRLNAIWKIDKHRRLPRLTWFFQDMYFGGEPVPWRPALNRRTVVAGGQILGWHHFPSAEAVRPLGHFWRVDLALADDPFPWPLPVVGLLERWHQSLGGWVIPRAFATVVTGGPPPILIPSGWPYQ